MKRRNGYSLTEDSFNKNNLNGKTDKRREIARLPRCLAVIILVCLLAAVSLATYAQFRPVVFSLPTIAYRFDRESRIKYQIQNKSSAVMDQTIQGMDMIYLSEYAQSVLPVFNYNLQADRESLIRGYHQIFAILRMKDQSDPNRILFEKSVPVSDKIEISFNGRQLNLEQPARVDFADYAVIIREFEQESDLAADYELEIGLQVDFEIIQDGNLIYNIQERPAIMMPLGNSTFAIKNQQLEDQAETVWRWQRWQLYLTPLPVWIYPVVMTACLGALIIFLIGTKPRKKPKFNKQVRRMMRKAKGRLMIIGEKAWEPEWCITARNFKTMIKTARKLKHPIFCYVDQDSEVPTAYFYVYYGENNYCYTFSGTPDKKWNQKRQVESASYNNKISQDELTDENEPIVQLPEKPEILQEENVSEENKDN